MDTQYFFRGDPPELKSPLQDCLPTFRPGIAASGLEQLTDGPGLILCPFGSSPQVAIEAARKGYQVIIPVHNPILRFFIRSRANPPSHENLSLALAKLSSSFKGKERLQPHILSLYETDCPQCGSKTSASSFIWSRETNQPVKKICRCSLCGEEISGTVSENDLKKALSFRENSPTYARALTRVTAPDDPSRFHVENALRSYPPRSLYALFTVLNKLASFSLSENEVSHLETLLLHGFSQCSHHFDPTEQENESDGFFVEKNVWYTLEEAVEIWSGDDVTLAITSWPDLPPETGGLCLFPGRIRDLIPQLESIQLQSILMVFPQPSPAFWALSALWTGWLWGQDSAAPLRSILSIKNFDWSWMTKAMELTLAEIHQVLPSGTPCLGLLPDLEINSLVSSISAAASAGFKLSQSGIDPDLRSGQTIWQSQKGIFDPDINEDHGAIIRNAGIKLLKDTGEPKHSLAIYNAGLIGLVAGGFPGENQTPEVYFPELLKDFEDNIAYRQGYLHFPESNSWWHQDLGLSEYPQTDQVERILVELLVKAKQPLTEDQIYNHIYQKFPTQNTPREGLIQTCLESYAEPSPDNQRVWILRSNDNPVQRVKDLEQIGAIIMKIGSNLGYTVTKNDGPGKVISLTWEKANLASSSFLISATGMLSRILLAFDHTADQNWIIMPGSRAGLIHYKLDHNPPLSKLLEDNWGMVKFRHIRRLAESNLNFLENLSLDPFQSDSAQLPLL